jgi:hypothetical protein
MYRNSIIFTLMFFLSYNPVYSEILSSPKQESSSVADLEPLHIFYGSKIGLSLLLAGTAATDPEAGPGERAIVGGSALLLGMPSSFVWHYSRKGDVEAVSRWRKISFVTDIGLSGGLAGFGAYLVSTGNVRDQWTGLSAVLVGLAGMALSTIDLRPFEFEK